MKLEAETIHVAFAIVQAADDGGLEPGGESEVVRKAYILDVFKRWIWQDLSMDWRCVRERRVKNDLKICDLSNWKDGITFNKWGRVWEKEVSERNARSSVLDLLN